MRSGGTREKDIALAIGLRLRDKLTTTGTTVVMTRDSDVNLGLADRAHVARDNRADAFISIHLNGDTEPLTDGTETWLHTVHSANSEALARLAQRELVAVTGRNDRGIKSKGLGVLNPAYHLPQTAACLAEVSFLTDPEEEQRLRSPNYQDRIADALCRAALAYLSIPQPAALAAVAEEDAVLSAANSVLAQEETTKWAATKAIAEAALSYWIAFFGMVKGETGNVALDDDATTRLKLIIRSISWVESRHGTAGANQPARDPMQCGNPADSWWRELTGQTQKQSRFVRGSGLSILNAGGLPAAADAAALPNAASLKRISNVVKGHDDVGFAASHSYYWGVPLLVHRINTGAGYPAYRCGDLSRDTLIDGAVAYNGNGDADYRKKIVAALALIGDLPPDASVAASLAAAPAQSGAIIGEALGRAIAAADTVSTRNFSSIRVTAKLGDGGNVRELEVEVTPS